MIKEKGTTPIEAICALAIICIMVAILAPVFMQARDKVRETEMRKKQHKTVLRLSNDDSLYDLPTAKAKLRVHTVEFDIEINKLTIGGRQVNEAIVPLKGAAKYRLLRGNLNEGVLELPGCKAEFRIVGTKVSPDALLETGVVRLEYPIEGTAKFEFN